MVKNMDAVKIGQFILEQRKRICLTQAQLAEKLNVTAQAVSKWENGRGIPDIDLLKKLSECFCVDISEIIEGENKKGFQTHRKAFAFVVAFLIILFLGIWWMFPKNDNSFQFSSLASNHEDFSLKGIVAYNDLKKSLFISDITYLSSDVEKYYGITCTLFEQNQDESKKISECGTSNTNEEAKYSMTKLLETIEFQLDDYSCFCQNQECSNLFLDIRLLNENKKWISYHVPLEASNSCTQRSV